ncbi:TlpA family protein disulfide reductase [Flavobacterium beibuense]|uniref:Thiol-disulfide isomerase-like thioredoxin n=1 Tax=Flavobacterium beibuense TaxID=657326 RepID=A0A444WJ64_9FLAO|nr:redoxin domain-containing protein [Flavobacterium beibuense]RYJ45786.1 Thiol-disulfide isomerase-like thioredoxin [Flavobacterium beibuense]
MKRLLLITVIMLFPLLCHSQSDSLHYFSDAIKVDLKQYKRESAIAYRKGDFERGKFLFDSLVENRLTGTRFDEFVFKKVRGGKFRFSKEKKPIILITYASWCVTSPGEIPALNKLAKRYGRDVKFVVVFWNRRHDMKKIARKFNHNITVCYAHETYKNDESAIASIKHTLGFPTSFYLDEDKNIVDIRRCGIKLSPKRTTYRKAYTLNYNSYLDGLSTIVLGKELVKETIAVK